MNHREWLGLSWVALASISIMPWPKTYATGASPVPAVVNFNRDIRPILSDNCFACHGPDKKQRKADLRLDSEKDAFADRGGYRVLVPGKPDQSELIQRINETDEKKSMPPAKFGKKLTPRQRALLRRWIEQGARWEKHWSLLANKRPSLPEVSSPWPRNAIDRFILARMEHEGLKPSLNADRRTLIRRLSFDLTGLPPLPKQVDAFLADKSADAYEKLVDRLLASKHYGERMAIYWLDLVRYADTGGYHSDNHRDVALYRDYVIQSFNDNKPFSQFTVEQLAGDLLPSATTAQKIASGYNRLLQTTEEGGAQAKEYQAKYLADRVRNTATIWLGSTLGCAECHDHKFDPFKTKEFYSFGAFFADLQERPVGRQEQVRLPTAEQASEIGQIDKQITALHKTLETSTPEIEAGQSAWEKRMGDDRLVNRADWIILKPGKAVSRGGATLTTQPDLSVLTSGKNPGKDVYTLTTTTDHKHITGIRLEALMHPSMGNQSLSRANGNFVLTSFEVEVGSPDNPKARPVKFVTALADFAQPGYPVLAAIDDKPDTGWAVAGHQQRANRTAVFVLARPLPGGPGTVLTIRMKHESPFPQHNIGRFRLSLTSDPRPGLSARRVLPPDVVTVLAVDPAKRSAAQKSLLAKHYRGLAPELDAVRAKVADLQRRRSVIEKAMPMTLISVAVPPRIVRVLPRGNWLDDSGPIVQPGVPASLSRLKSAGSRATRLDLARWMVSPENPLTARVFVNRLWKLMFGQGLVKTLDDFGSQGAWPTHPDLLDWLAVEFVESGWDVKHVIKLMALSAAYRQSSHADATQRQRDPYNYFLARQGRFRLDAEMVRDNALAVSGLLSHKIGGPSVKPYQPVGYWMHLNFPRRTYQPDHGENQYRRGLYTYWQRTFPHPSLLAFDAPSREECTVERPRSNTPLQALVLLNDPTYVEAARALAEHILRDGGKSVSGQIQFAFHRVLAREARPAEVQLLATLHARHLKQFQADPRVAEAMLHVGERPMASDLDTPTLAAWTSVARVLLNLHETITRN